MESCFMVLLLGAAAGRPGRAAKISFLNYMAKCNFLQALAVVIGYVYKKMEAKLCEKTNGFAQQNVIYY